MAKLYFYYSAMNAGKTTTLLQSAHNYHERGMRTLILTPKLDNRYGEGVVASRIGLSARGRVFERDADLLAIVRADIDGMGTYYRVRIPANTCDEAIQLCTSYKAAGGSCFVSR